MSALFGYTGAPEPQYHRAMYAAIRHRGDRRLDLHEAPGITIGFGHQFDETSASRFHCGTFNTAQGVIATAGILRSSVELESVLEDLRTNPPDALHKLRGQFVLVFNNVNTTILARDPAGERTIYYGMHEGRLFFAVEPKGICAIPGFPRRIRPGAVAQYLSFSFMPSERTMLEDVYELPAGHYLTHSPGSVPQLHRYFVPESVELNGHLSDDDWTKQFATTFSKAVVERFPASEDIGLFLSGGIDSSIVAAEVAKQSSRPLKTYAIHFGEKYPNELEFARMVADCCGTDHEEVLVQPKDFIPRLRDIIWHLDDPIGDPVTMPNFELARRVSKDVRFVFNGEGGDPCFGGPKNMPMLLNHWYGGVPRSETFREQQYLASYRRGYEEIQHLLTPEFLALIDPQRDLEAVLTPFFQADEPKGFLEKLIAINIRLKGAHLILPKVERMTGAFGITPLAPLFDDRLVRMTFAMPGRMKLDRGIEKVVLKRAFEGRLPQAIIDRPKSGMRVPVHFWFQKEMRRYARSVLNRRSINAEGIWRWDRVRQLLNYATDEGPGRYGLRLWMLLTFEIWRQIVIEGKR